MIRSGVQTLKLIKQIKFVVLCLSAIGVISCVTWANRSRASSFDGDYVGSEACKDCHEDQFKAFSHTSHASLAKISGWKEKVTGCEACHGPGKAHLEEGDPAKIIWFKNKSPKEW